MIANDKIYTLSEIETLLKQFFKDRDIVDKVFLFGSYAKNEAKEDSDIDLVIEMSQHKGRQFFELYDYLEEIFKKKIDLVTQKQLEVDNPFINRIKKELILVYDREKVIEI